MIARLLQSSDDESPSLCSSSFYTALCIAGTQCSLLVLPQLPFPSPTLLKVTRVPTLPYWMWSLVPSVPPTEEIRASATYALGSVSTCNLQLYLPVILQGIEARPRRQCLLLHSFKEVREGRVGVGGSEGRGRKEGEGRISAV